MGHNTLGWQVWELWGSRMDNSGVFRHVGITAWARTGWICQSRHLPVEWNNQARDAIGANSLFHTHIGESPAKLSASVSGSRGFRQQGMPSLLPKQAYLFYSAGRFCQSRACFVALAVCSVWYLKTFISLGMKIRSKSDSSCTGGVPFGDK